VVASIVSFALAGALSVSYIEAGEDSSCGTVLYDSRTESVCGRAMLQQRTAVSVLVLTGLVAGSLWWLARASRGPSRIAEIAVMLLVVAAVASVVISVRAFADPGESAYGYPCGSRLNPVVLQGSIPDEPAGCDAYLSDQRTTGAAAAAAAVLIGAASFVISRRNKSAAAPAVA
jgi:hypothetical protein